jgi:spore coat polysaccharide biosynthesis predicted glycosyltransferase SpsG
VIGAANGADLVAALEGGAKQCIPHDVRLEYAVTNMAEKMAWADLAITAGGSTCLELCCVGVPGLVLAVSDNQRRVMEGFAARGLMRSLGWYEALTPARLAEQIDALRADASARAAMVRAQHMVVDGKGTGRVVHALLEAYGARGLAKK